MTACGHRRANGEFRGGVASRRPHTSCRRFSRRRICHETSEIVSARCTMKRAWGGSGIYSLFFGRLSYARSDTHNSTCCATAPVLTTCSFIVNAVRGTNVSTACFWLRDMSRVLNIVARSRSRPALPATSLGYRTIQVPRLSCDALPRVLCRTSL